VTVTFLGPLLQGNLTTETDQQLCALHHGSVRAPETSPKTILWR